MASGRLSKQGKSKVGESQPAGNDIFSFLQSSEINYGLDTDELEIHPEEEAQVNIPTQRSESQTGNRGEEETSAASQKLKSGLFVYHFTKIKNESSVVSVSCKHCSKTYRWSTSGGYGTF